MESTLYEIVNQTPLWNDCRLLDALPELRPGDAYPAVRGPEALTQHPFHSGG
jgi:hypothetical protein